jgi:hypothetical protein
MRIVNRNVFLTLPSGTVFLKFPEQPKEPIRIDLGYDSTISIKGDTVGDDFVVQSLSPWFVGIKDGDDWLKMMASMLNGHNSPLVDYDYSGRDGLFDRGQLFLVWEKDDLERMIGRLKDALFSGYTDS